MGPKLNLKDVRPGSGRPGTTARPGTARPGTARPGTARPGTAASNARGSARGAQDSVYILSICESRGIPPEIGVAAFNLKTNECILSQVVHPRMQQVH
jgi:hypothetical protein